MKALSLTEKGKKALEIKDSESNRHGGPEHRYWVRVIAKHLRTQGYEVTEEAPVGDGKTIDLVAAREGKRIAFEIETGKSDVVANVHKCLDAGMEEVVVVAVSDKIREILSKVLPEKDRVGLVTAPELIMRNE